MQILTGNETQKIPYPIELTAERKAEIAQKVRKEFGRETNVITTAGTFHGDKVWCDKDVAVTKRRKTLPNFSITLFVMFFGFSIFLLWAFFGR